MDRIQTPGSPTMGYADLAQIAHEKHCEHCRTLTQAATARDAARTAAYGESIRRRDRIQLGLHLATDSDPDLDEALRRARAAGPAVTA